MLSFEFFRNFLLCFKQRSRPNWADLPQDIVGLIINKLRFTDQIRALAVCKGWHKCADYVRCSDRLSWAVTYKVEQCERYKYSVMYELFDPYSQKVHKVPNSVESCVKPRGTHKYGYASKNGWLLQEFIGFDHQCDTSFFLHNPFKNQIIVLPFFADSGVVRASMKNDPSSPECEVFILSFQDGYLCINTYCLYKDYDFQLELAVRTTLHDLHSVLYMKGNIYALFEKGVLYSYSLDEKSWKLLTPGFQEPYNTCGAWLLETDGNMIMVHVIFEGETDKWMIFMFDCSEMSWVVNTSLKSRAIYISGLVAFSAPLTNCYGKNLEGWMLFYNEEVVVDSSDDAGFKCYSCNELTGSEIRSNVYGWTPEFNFVEPPYSVR